MSRQLQRGKRQRQKDRPAVLAQVTRELTTDLDLMGVLRRTLALSVRAVRAAVGTVMLLDEEGRLGLVIHLDEGKYRRGDMDLARSLLQEGIAGWMVEHREPVLLNDVEDDPRWIKIRSGAYDRPARAAICVPLLLPRRVVGLLICTHPEVGRFDEEDLRVLQVIADQATVALENAQLFAAEEQRRGLADTLSEIVRKVTATLELDEVLDLILVQLGRLVPYDDASIYLLQDERLAIRAWRGIDDPSAVQGVALHARSDGILSRVVQSAEPVVYSDVQQEAAWKDLLGESPARGWIGAPLIAREEVIGALAVESREPNAYRDSDARVVAAFADHAAIAVANARLLQQIQRQLEEVAFLHQTGQTLTASLELTDVLRSLMNSVRDHYRTEAASVALVDEETGDVVFQAASGAAASQVVGVRLKPGQGIAGWVVESGEPVLVPAAEQDSRHYNGVDRETGFQTRTIIAVPIRLGQETIGVIEAINPQDGRLDVESLGLLTNVAALAASAIQNARHFKLARDAEQRYASLFENSADPIVITDASGAITDVNLRLCEVLGYEKDDLLGREIITLHADAVATAEGLASVLEGESLFCRSAVITRDGTSVQFEVRATRVFYGSQPNVQWVYHDLTERLQLEQARQDLMHMIIHDLRNPLSSLVNSVDLIHTAMVDKTITIPVEELFTVASRSGERLYLLIDSILDLARLEDGRAELASQDLEIEEMVAEVVEQMMPTVAARELTLESTIAKGLPRLVGDRSLLQRTLLNLLSNAVKFTPAGGTIRMMVSLQDSQTVLFTVSDTGPGIAPEYHERIFDRFAQADRHGKRGTGLGLALCKLVVESHQGRIWVESDVGKGATFRFTLPVIPEETAM